MIRDNNHCIKNIYYMLSYAFKVLRQQNYAEIEGETFDNIYKLFACILKNGIAQQLKQGLYREYIEVEEELSTVRGKIEIMPSTRLKLQKKQKVCCRYDNYSVNNIFNQIIKTTVQALLGTNEIGQEYRADLKREMLFFGEVDTISANVINWQTLRFQKNNQSYKMLLNVCFFIINGLLLADNKGNYKVMNYMSDEHMHTLYEHFILEYYKYHYDKVLKASAMQVKWATDEDLLPIMPKMQTDIMLTNGKKSLIIDAKYYSKILTNNQFSKETLRSQHLYQIFTYVENYDKDNNGNVEGLLLYAKTEDETLFEDVGFMLKGKSFNVKTLDLSLSFVELQKQLDAIARDTFQVEKNRK